MKNKKQKSLVIPARPREGGEPESRKNKKKNLFFPFSFWIPVFTGMTFFFFFLFSPVLARADEAIRVNIHNIDVDNRNVVISFPKEDQKWLLHYKKGCTGLNQNSTSVTLIIQGDLNANQDFVKVGQYDQCEVDQAEEINAEFTVDSTFPSELESILANEKGARFSVGHPQSCRAIRTFLHKHIYADLGDKTIQEGDKIYFPAKAGTCIAGFTRPIKDAPKVEQSKPAPLPATSDQSAPVEYTRPGVIFDLKATPTDGGAELSWRIARDVENVDYYWVVYSRSPLKTKDYTVENMPDKQKATTHFYKVTGLDNNKQYYFYVISIDKKGHPASDWSNAASGTPTASAFRSEVIPQGNIHLNFRVKKETDQSFIFEWDLIPRATRYLVALEMDGKRDWVLQGVRSTAYVNKTPERKGKNLRFVVRAYNRYGMLDEAYYTFKF